MWPCLQTCLLVTTGGRACHPHPVGEKPEHPTVHGTSHHNECQDCRGPETLFQWCSTGTTQQTHSGPLTILISRISGGSPALVVSESLPDGSNVQPDCSKLLVLGASAPLTASFHCFLPVGGGPNPPVRLTATLCSLSHRTKGQFWGSSVPFSEVHRWVAGERFWRAREERGVC